MTMLLQYQYFYSSLCDDDYAFIVFVMITMVLMVNFHLDQQIGPTNKNYEVISWLTST